MQIIFTPNGLYKIFRNLVIGHLGTGDATGSPKFYVSKNIGVPASMPIKKLAYFMIGVGGPVSGEITREFYDSGTGGVEAGGGCLQKDATDPPAPPAINPNDTRGGLNWPIKIYGAGIGYGGSMYKKALVADNFYNYDISAESKVLGTNAVVAGGSANWWDIAGTAFQVACHLAQAEGNFYKDGSPVLSPATVEINELGIFDEDDVMMLYGAFSPKEKNDTLTFKANCVAMLKALDYQLILVP